MGCRPGPRHGIIILPSLPGKCPLYAELDRVTRASVFTQHWEGGAPGLCPPSVRMEMAGSAPVSHCRLLTILKVLRSEVEVFRSLPAMQGRGTGSWQPGSAEGWSQMHLLGGCQRMGAMEKAVSCPFGDRAVAPQSNNPLPGLLSFASAARTLCQCQSWCLCWTATAGHQD